MAGPSNEEAAYVAQNAMAVTKFQEFCLKLITLGFFLPKSLHPIPWQKRGKTQVFLHIPGKGDRGSQCTFNCI